MQFKRNKNFTVSGLLCLILLLAGCDIDNRYLSQKLFWKAKKKVKELAGAKGGKLGKEDIPEVVSIYQEVIDKTPLEKAAADAHFIIADIYLANKEFDKARAELLKIVQNFSKYQSMSSKAIFSIGKIHELQGNWEAALEEYDKIMDLYPLSEIGITMPVYITSYYIKNNDPEEKDKVYRRSIRHFESLINIYEGTSIAPAVYDHLAGYYFFNKAIDEAFKTWDIIIDQYEQSPLAIKAYLAKASVYHDNLKDKEKAVEVLTECLKKHSDHKIAPQIMFRIGTVYLEKNDTEKAKDMFNKLLEKAGASDKFLINAYLGLSYAYRKEANTEKVVEIYNKLYEEFPDKKAGISAPFLIAQYYWEIKLNTKAEKAVNRAIDIYEKIVSNKDANKAKIQQAENLLVLCYIKKKDFDKALKILSSLSKKYPKNPLYLMDMAAVYRNLNSLEKAKETYNKIIEKFKGNEKIVAIAKKQLRIIDTD